MLHGCKAVLTVAVMLCAGWLGQAQAEDAKSAAKSADEAVWSELLAGNQRFVAGQPQAKDFVAQRQKLVSGQHPKAAVLSCSDSRVAPEIVFDQGLGDLFVVRNAGNSAAPVGIGSLEYAVEHLGVQLIVVLGHQSCGAVKAACSGGKMPTPELALVVAPVAASCSLGKQKHAKDVVDFAVQDHIHRTAVELLRRSHVLMHARHEGKLQIVEAEYSLETGAVTKLK